MVVIRTTLKPAGFCAFRSVTLFLHLLSFLPIWSQFDKPVLLDPVSLRSFTLTSYSYLSLTTDLHTCKGECLPETYPPAHSPPLHFQPFWNSTWLLITPMEPPPKKTSKAFESSCKFSIISSYSPRSTPTVTYSLFSGRAPAEKSSSWGYYLFRENSPLLYNKNYKTGVCHLRMFLNPIWGKTWQAFVQGP